MAELGFYLDRVPVLGSIFLTGQTVDGEPVVAALALRRRGA